MRQIGTLPGTTDPRIFGDYLLSLGISSRAIKTRDDAWAVWVHNEDLLTPARSPRGLSRQPRRPQVPCRRQNRRGSAAREEKLNRQYRKNVRDISTTWDGLHVRRRPFTTLIVGVCVALFVAQELNPVVKNWLLDHLEFFSNATFKTALAPNGNPLRGLDDIIQRGQLWRLFTPCLLHHDLLHIAFNMWATIVLGTIIESRRGTRALLVLVLVTGIGSNVGQFIYMLNFTQQLNPWVGFSGVVYALFGYIWMKGQYEPEQGMIFHPSTVRIMLLWLLLGFSGFGNLANGAHGAGLILGALFGLARF